MDTKSYIIKATKTINKGAATERVIRNWESEELFTAASPSEAITKFKESAKSGSGAAIEYSSVSAVEFKPKNATSKNNSGVTFHDNRKERYGDGPTCYGWVLCTVSGEPDFVIVAGKTQNLADKSDIEREVSNLLPEGAKYLTGGYDFGKSFSKAYTIKLAKQWLEQNWGTMDPSFKFYTKNGSKLIAWYDQLAELKECLFDAPSEVKSAFNRVVKYLIK